MEQRGKGAANATVTSWLEPADDGTTTVRMTADITLSGAAAQMSRGLLPEISKKLTQQFADCLEATIASSAVPATEPMRTTQEVVPEGHPADGREAEAAPVAVAEPVGGIRLGLAAIWSLIAGFFRRLFGGGRSPAP